MCPARCVICVEGRSLSWWRETMVQELELCGAKLASSGR